MCEAKKKGVEMAGGGCNLEGVVGKKVNESLMIFRNFEFFSNLLMRFRVISCQSWYSYRCVVGRNGGVRHGHLL